MGPQSRRDHNLEVFSPVSRHTQIVSSLSNIHYNHGRFDFWCAAYAISGLDRVALGQNDVATVQVHLLDALRLAREMDSLSLTIFPLAGMMRWYAATGNDERAIELRTFLTPLPASWQATCDQVSQVVIEAASRLPAERLAGI